LLFEKDTEHEATKTSSDDQDCWFLAGMFHLLDVWFVECE
jgi:hypothetical protein